MIEVNDVTQQQNEPGSTNVQKPGELVRTCREAAGISQSAVAEALHLTVHYIKALENDEYGKLPGLTFVKGYFRSYARFLQMDMDAVVSGFEAYLNELGERSSAQENTYRLRRRNDQVVLWAVVAGIILVLGLAAGWWFFGREKAGKPAVVAVPVSRNVRNTAAVRNIIPDRGVALQSTITSPDTLIDQQEIIFSDANEISRAEAADYEDDFDVVQQESISIATESSEVMSVRTDDAAESPQTEDAVLPDDNQDISSPEASIETSVTTPVAASVESTVDPFMPGSNLAVTHKSDGARSVSLVAVGEDLLQLYFIGNSWVEIDDPDQARLYYDLLGNGDDLNIHGGAPFYVLLGDATQVKVQFNSQPVNIRPRIRSDNTARFVIGQNGITVGAVR